MPDQATPPSALPFGKHKGAPLPTVPTDYLAWVARTMKLSSGLRIAVADELRRRGEAVPEASIPSLPPCRTCGAAGAKVEWMVNRDGRRHLRADCAICGRYLIFPPCVAPYTTAADSGEVL